MARADMIRHRRRSRKSVFREVRRHLLFMLGDSCLTIPLLAITALTITYEKMAVAFCCSKHGLRRGDAIHQQQLNQQQLPQLQNYLHGGKKWLTPVVKPVKKSHALFGSIYGPSLPDQRRDHLGRLVDDDNITDGANEPQDKRYDSPDRNIYSELDPESKAKAIAAEFDAAQWSAKNKSELIKNAAIDATIGTGGSTFGGVPGNIDLNALKTSVMQQSQNSQSAPPSQQHQLKQNAADSGPLTTEGKTEKGLIAVRFVNYDPTGIEKVVYTKAGTNLLKIADEANIKVPRQCRSGLCGTCTADVKDPTWREGERPGYQTIRTCQAGAMIPFECDEMVIDLYRMTSTSSTASASVGVTSFDANSIPQQAVSGAPPTSGSMDRFDDGWETAFVPDYKAPGANSAFRSAANPVVGSAHWQSALTAGDDNDEYEEYTVYEEEDDVVRWIPGVGENIAPWEVVY